MKSKNIFLLMAVMALFHTTLVLGQSDKDVKKYKIKAIGLSETKYDEDGEVDENNKLITKYDAAGNLIEEEEYKDGKLDKKKTYKYNKENDLIEQNTYSSDGSLKKRTVISYNAFGEKDTELSYNAAGKLVEKSIHVYDSKGLKKEKQTYNASGKLIAVKKYTYTF